MTKIAKNTVCLWHERDVDAAAQFYARTFPDSSVGAVYRAPGDFPSGKQGDVLTVEFTVMGIPCLGLNGGAAFKQHDPCTRCNKSSAYAFLHYAQRDYGRHGT
jgi:predicted 3-demethylubiquinone-9 3-methyltransferase (glyoxalase superfamily)